MSVMTERRLRLPCTVAAKVSMLALMLVFMTDMALGERAGVDDGMPPMHEKSIESPSGAKVDAIKYTWLRHQGVDEVSHTQEAHALRQYLMKQKKRKGLFTPDPLDMSRVLFPGVSPEQYHESEYVNIYTELVTSKQTHVPFQFYDLPTCSIPATTPTRQMRMNLGERLEGYDRELAPFTMRVKKNQGCTPLCQVTMDGKKLRWTRKLVNDLYRIYLTFDQLPVLMRSPELNYAAKGYPVGFRAPPSFTGLSHDEFYLYNHMRFTVTYHEDPSLFEGVRILGFDVHPVSIDHQVATCKGARKVANAPNTYLQLRMGPMGALSVLYSYEVEWVQSDLHWADRWDVYFLNAADDNFHIFSIVNCLAIVLVVAGVMFVTMVRTLRKDMAGYKKSFESGWTVLKGEVFRPPRFSPMLLSVAVGTGAQIGFASFLTLLFSVVGLMNPLIAGQTLTTIIVLYALCGVVGGYVSGRLYKYFNGRAWEETAKMTATALPGAFMFTFLVLNTVLSIVGAATAVSILTMLALLVIWACVMTPLAFAGTNVGFMADKMEVPTETNRVARLIPDQPWYCEPPVSSLLCGILPFACIYNEVILILEALWLQQVYYATGYLLVMLVLFTVLCAEVSIAMCYVQLRSENHRWWWNSFFNCASAGLYLFLFCLWFLASRMELVAFLPVMIYVTYSAIIAVCFGFFCGSIGVFSAFWFSKVIYRCSKAASSSTTDGTDDPKTVHLLSSMD